MRRVVALVAVLLVSFTASAQQADVQLNLGEAAPFAGVLVPLEVYQFMVQAVSDVPSLEREIVLWEAGHGRAITALEMALEAVQNCRAPENTLDRILGIVRDAAAAGALFYCATRSTEVVFE